MHRCQRGRSLSYPAGAPYHQPSTLIAVDRTVDRATNGPLIFSPVARHHNFSAGFARLAARLRRRILQEPGRLTSLALWRRALSSLFASGAFLPFSGGRRVSGHSSSGACRSALARLLHPYALRDLSDRHWLIRLTLFTTYDHAHCTSADDRRYYAPKEIISGNRRSKELNHRSISGTPLS
jgi:hypothetical protein